MAKPRKKRADSIDHHVSLAAQAMTRVESPIALDEKETDIFNSIIESMPSDTLDRYRVRLSATLAKQIAWSEMLMVMLQEEGPVVINDRGTQISNPLQSQMVQTSNSIQALSRTLGLSASQRGLSESKTQARKQADQSSRTAVTRIDDSDGLLAN